MKEWIWGTNKGNEEKKVFISPFDWIKLLNDVANAICSIDLFLLFYMRLLLLPNADMFFSLYFASFFYSLCVIQNELDVWVYFLCRFTKRLYGYIQWLIKWLRSGLNDPAWKVIMDWGRTIALSRGKMFLCLAKKMTFWGFFVTRISKVVAKLTFLKMRKILKLCDLLWPSIVF